MINNIDVKAVVENCLRDEANAISSLISQLDDSLERAVTLMYACHGKIVVTGVGKSGHIGAKVAATLASTGTPAFYVSPLDLFHGDLGVIENTDIVLALSNSGQTDELLRLVPYLKENDIPLIGISGNPESLLARNSDVHLTVKVQQEACPLNLAPTSSTTAQLAMGDALACALMEVRHFKARDFAQFHPGGSLGRRLLTRAQDVMRTDDLPTLSPSVTLGEAIILVSRSMLGLAVAVEADRVVGIITDGDVRRAMERLQQDFFRVPVGQVMTRAPKCVSPETKISDIQALMHCSKIHAVLVTDQQHHLLGIVDSFACHI